jgi:hypothetical protein
MADDAAVAAAEVEDLKNRMTEEGEALETSAQTIQAIARGRKARRGDRRKVVQGSTAKTESELAAAKLQSMQRGKLARQRVKDMKVSS